MPKKIRELKSLLLQSGFTYKPAKGSHSKWIHPKLSKAIIIAGKDSSDAKQYLEKQFNEAIAELNKIEAEEKEELEE
ncbi:type II toxin-antitoxin system HicA family toxin [Anabaena cylindrica FACHB-243]|uniref:YcfA family protein n=1 Tax=Anabaena cylindrica (strain ATCC 27899 / PCC 7122) TaxID=272123 RepID=K9ZHR8_ANACC|nr:MULTISPECIES: type II toxin-antitoxin system HicA family toxin [Anabaena]AFZ57895.1 YcfA family protein [Anabaena cylindrica PCC 7122]MBD2419749.1 type II toxin-antitoxin system HicA family toxin [Anabaena cylindrica FACHB-243]MBY5281547.1 type II toxin-antitoxin system HicA family toxin [Anabaena sp. CCAP 1446/1C]MBY5307200.1 type II toxin-antitoxin system HicA family toxin [Anabaena sp. CCAP 1446/1C]MCM2405563.1 type II toxin-antitoxin system HicA family toxin [Anabaena sp. CCAP 1446/1C]